MKRYFIYTLSSPITQETFYVGVTSEYRMRHRQHYARFANLFFGLTPVMTVIDVIHSNAQFYAFSLERYWINEYFLRGANLINKRGLARVFDGVSYQEYRNAVSESNIFNYNLLFEKLLGVDSKALKKAEETFKMATARNSGLYKIRRTVS